jgi:flagellar biosynthetic protein FliQ
MQRGLLTILLVSAPPVLMGLVVGVLVSIFQTVTSINEPTLAFIPKILAVLSALIIFGPFMLSTLEEYMVDLASSIPGLLTPR